MSRSAPAATKRLIILMHGSHGHASDFDDLAALLTKQVAARAGSGDSVSFARPTEIQGRATDQGVMKCVTNLTPVVRRSLAAFGDACRNEGVNGRVSVVGHSLGGVLLRGVVARLDRDGGLLSQHYSLDSFVSVCSPHLGIGHTSRTMQSVARWAAGTLSSRTYLDLLLDTPALDQLAADPHADRGLSEFRRRVAITATGDHLVPPSSALIGPVSRDAIRDLASRSRAAGPDNHLVQTELEQFSGPEPADIYSTLLLNPAEKAGWERAAPRLDETRMRRVVAMSRMLRGVGRAQRFESYVAVFPTRESTISHRAVIGKAPWSGTRLRAAHVQKLAEVILANPSV